jgi:hypothetical protein
MRTIRFSAFFLALFFTAGIALAPAEDIAIEIVIAPNVLNLEAYGTWVTVHATIPYGSVDTSTVYLNGVEVDATKADSRGELVAKFLLEGEIRNILRLGSNTLTLCGRTKDGEGFSGTDEILVISRSGKH